MIRKYIGPKIYDYNKDVLTEIYENAFNLFYSKWKHFFVIFSSSV